MDVEIITVLNELVKQTKILQDIYDKQTESFADMHKELREIKCRLSDAQQ